MALEQYKEKRNFKKTSEPIGIVLKKREKKLIFVVHRHFSKNPHFDLRLEMNGVLASWAVPKEPPTEKGVKRLAIQVEDHPLEYATFKGTIPEGNYGAGKVEIWDKGKYNLIERQPKKMFLEKFLCFADWKSLYLKASICLVHRIN